MNEKRKKTRKYRLALIDDRTHEQLLTWRFTKVNFVVTLTCAVLTILIATTCILAYTPARNFIPGYPDSNSKRAAIQNAIRIDSLENVIFKWEIYTENLKRVVAGEEAIKIDSIIKLAEAVQADASDYSKSDSVLREHVKEEEQFGISDRVRRDLPIEGMHFFTPVKGVISQGYDKNLHPYVDITAPAGSVVKATLDGTVIFSGWSDEAGNTIQIQHDGDIVSIYKHNEKLLKRVGEKVTAGSPIALIGDTGSLSTGEHLHFELWHKGESVDPTRYINF